MTSTEHTQSTGDSTRRQGNQPQAQQPLRGVRQDKNARDTDPRASTQPVTDEKGARSRSVETHYARTQKRSSRKRKTVPVMLWVKPGVKSALQRIAEQEELSVSATGAAFLEQAIQQDIHTQHGALLDTIIAQAIRKHMRAISTRLALLLVRVAFDTGQTRCLVTNLLSRQPGVTPTILNTLLDESSTTAKRNITRTTPQLEAIRMEFEHLFSEKTEGERESV